jgi:hypothetical protein
VYTLLKEDTIMVAKRSGAKLLVLALAAVLLLSLPLTTGAAMTNGITKSPTRNPGF